MQFLGGKSRIARKIAGIINKFRSPGQVYLEPFIGGCSVFHLIKGPKIGADIHRDLVLMWQAVQNGWEPPRSVSEREYYDAKRSPSSALRGFIGFGCSFGGKWFGGYARVRSDGYNYAEGSRNSVLKKRSGILDSKILHHNYLGFSGIKGAIIYCDPPYQGTTSYSNLFDSAEFWEMCRYWARNNIVLISEYSAPAGVKLLTEFNPYKSMQKHQTEKLFLLSSTLTAKEEIFMANALPRIIHSSLKEVRRLGTDSDFPAHTPSIGALIRVNHFGGAVLETHTPKLSSLIEGETFECDMSDLDTELRVRILALASTCRSLAAELLDHAARLETHARSESDLINNSDNRPESPESHVPTSYSGFVPSTCKSRARIVQSDSRLESPSKSRTPVPNLDLFD